MDQEHEEIEPYIASHRRSQVLLAQDDDEEESRSHEVQQGHHPTLFSSVTREWISLYVHLWHRQEDDSTHALAQADDALEWKKNW